MKQYVYKLYSCTKIRGEVVRKLITLGLVLMTASVFAVEGIASLTPADSTNDSFLDFGSRNFEKIDSHFFYNIGIGYHELQSDHTFKGKHKEYEKNDNEFMKGIDLGIGRDYNWIGKFSTSLSLSAFYAKNDDQITNKASEDVPEDVSTLRDLATIYGGGAEFAIKYQISTESLNWQPFVAIGVGQATIVMEKNYEYDAVEKENYNVEMKDSTIFTSQSVGLNVISKKGLFSYLKYSRTQYNLLTRKSEGYYKKADDDKETKVKDTDRTSETNAYNSYALGMGYMF